MTTVDKQPARSAGNGNRSRCGHGVGTTSGAPGGDVRATTRPSAPAAPAPRTPTRISPDPSAGSGRAEARVRPARSSAAARASDVAPNIAKTPASPHADQIVTRIVGLTEVAG